MSPVDINENTHSNPLVDLTVSISNILNDLDAVFVTHIHRDHWDTKAIELLPKDIPLFCQPSDEEKIKNDGFTNVTPVPESVQWNGIEISRTSGQHGNAEMSKIMGPVSGFILNMEAEPVIYVAGDTLWVPEVEEALEKHKPEVIILFAGAARMKQGGLITMGKEDILKVSAKAQGSRIIVAHMESWNHCLLTRRELKDFLAKNSILEYVSVPADGESIQI